MKRLGSSFLMVLSAVCSACEEDVDPQRYERVVMLENEPRYKGEPRREPLALFSHDDAVFAALPSELVRFDRDTHSPVKLADGRYQECPWDPSHSWNVVIDPRPRITPQGDYITFVTLCGSWAWPIAGDNALPLAHIRSGPVTADPADTLPQWTDYSTIAGVGIARDGDGWIAWGDAKPTDEDEQGVLVKRVFWSLGPDGAAREQLFEFDEVFGDESPSSKNLYEVHPEAESIFVMIEPVGSSVRRSVLGRIDRASKTWHELHTWQRLPNEEPPRPRVEFAAMTASHIVVSDGDQLARIAKTGGPLETILPCSACVPIGGDATHVFWFDRVDGIRLFRAPYEGSKGELLLALEKNKYVFDGDNEIDRVKLGFTLTSDAIWFTTFEGLKPREQRLWLSRLPKPRP